jgi:hypothetical protein
MPFVLTGSFASYLIEGTETCGPPDFEMLPTRDTLITFQETVLNLNTGEYACRFVRVVSSRAKVV